MTYSNVHGEVAIRMYRGILGDCFLLRFQEEESTRHVLIDCGVLQGVTGAKETMTRIVDDIHKTTDGVLDLVVLTHEHHDHLSGFLYEQARFFGDDFRFGELWLAWTENLNDPQAVALHARFKKAKAALAGVAALGKRGSALHMEPRMNTVRGLSAFIEPAAGKGKLSTVDKLKAKAGVRATRYLEPGDVVRPQAISMLKTYVMGPPRSEERLRKDLPSKGAGKEVYLTSLDEAVALEERTLRLKGEDLLDVDMPFARPYQRTFSEVKGRMGAGGGSAEPGNIEQRYFNDEEQWRCIEDEWLDGAETLALKMDSDTNNTSLVLAFELPDGQILLFPGDAQVGNWISWGDQTYPKNVVAGDATPLTRDDILARVTLYKVGHHCSHNATARAQGLEKMHDTRLVAMIPVVAEVAKGNKWNMPYPDLLSALQKRTRERIVSGDGQPATELKAFKAAPTDPDKPAILSYAADELWVELLISY
ncbi:MBL fold metallo-hydrolase [Pseudomonas putida]|uniref:MBL fold metallo-hydrolase n=1 Tax=Pseudomonas putida TaxID=303 RepID=UPI003D968399